MPFGLTNAPAVFQRLMQQALMGLNPEEGPDFLAVYIDDVLVFSRTLEDHMRHLSAVIHRLQEVGLKLKPKKCYFIRQSVEYLGHLITTHRLQPNPKLVQAVQEFPVCQNLKNLYQFLGLSSYYSRFIPGYAKIAQPLHKLTRKDTEFHWTSECQDAFEELKQKLTTAPVLAYPSFDKDFILETDASIQGIGAVLSKVQDDGLIHPVAYASHSLSKPEANYSITELETSAVVWAVTYFHSYLYGHFVTVFTDHAAVKAVLKTPNPSGKHVRWWSKVYGRGVKEVKIMYRSGKVNLNADALSRSSQAPAPEEGIAQSDKQVSVVDSERANIEDLLEAPPASNPYLTTSRSSGRIPESYRSSTSLRRRSSLQRRSWHVRFPFRVLCSTLWAQNRRVAGEWWCQSIFENKSWKRTIAVTRELTSLEVACSTCSPDTGGGKEYMLTLCTLPETVPSVPWCLVAGE